LNRSLGVRRHCFNGLNLNWLRLRDVVDFFLETLQGLTDPFSDLRELSRAKDDEHDD
jgi:hypothetical protein